MKKSKWVILLMIALAVGASVYFLFFHKNMSKSFKIGNNMSSQEIVDYILNISSYKAKISVQINSNKNSNKYILSQEYISPNTNKQEIIEPENIAGVMIERNENGLTLENTRLDLQTIFENYSYIGDNCLDLSAFLADYHRNANSTWEEKDNQIIMKTENESKYRKHKTLYIDKASGLPVKMEIKDDNQNTTVNILYNEVEINNFN